ncbi:MAG: hypothetical protein PHE88_00685 [Elusimicrobia bacterium]|nr:hypothetical protein [Elusimicrobiota bacterium]
MSNRIVVYDKKEIVDLLKTTLAKFELNPDETTVSELIAELQGDDDDGDDDE